jgi:ABC-type phosphate transport system substrate-binding protein
MKKLCYILCFSLTLITANAQADVVLVVAENSPLESLNRHDVQDIFLGKSASIPKIGKVTPLDRNDEKLREQFYTAYTNKTLSQVKAHWARIIFTGRGQPPKTVGLEELKATLRNNPTAIGYMSADKVDDGLKILKTN